MGFEPKIDILPPAQLRFWRERNSVPGEFVLYDGTAIALRLGHRHSEDFDFFSSAPFQPAQLLDALSFGPEAVVLQSEHHTLTLRIDRDGPVKLSFFSGLTFGQIATPDVMESQAFTIASLPDLMATKLKVLWQRAEAKDYVDVATIIRAGVSLEHGLGCARALFGETFNPAIVLKALTFFDDGDLKTLNSDVRALLIDAARSVQEIPPIRCAALRIDASTESLSG